MANTQGMSDEVLESLLMGQGDGDNDKSTAPASSDRKHRSAMGRRMQLPLGERPAARVIRPSRGVRLSTVASSSTAATRGVPLTTSSGPADNDRQQQQQQQPPSSTTTLAAPAVMGDIVERRRPRRQQQKQTSMSQPVSQNKSQSRFAAAAATTGFPTLQVPLGRLVKAPTRAKTTTDSTTAVSSSSSSSRPDHHNTTVTSTTREAQAMLDQMSVAEIQEQVHELEAALSPETIAFLKQRGQQKQQQQLKQQQQQLQTVSNQESPRLMSESSVSTVETTRNQKNGFDIRADDPDPCCFRLSTNDKRVNDDESNVDDRVVKEKERLAHILSSIQTHADMDAAYAHEMGQTLELGKCTDGTLNDLDVHDATDDDFIKACGLLRSSMPRQNLWAARLVCHVLQRHVERQQQDQFSYTLPGAASKTPWPYPLLLPVSLRCLLDASGSGVNGWILHTYVLQSLYSLLQLRVSCDHDDAIDIQPEKAATLYQFYFMEDAIPTPSPQLTYASTQDLEHDATTGVAYRTVSAQHDGEAFAQDPLWTLLSRMRILPRLAQLLQSNNTSQDEDRQFLFVSWSPPPPEAVVAMIGILALVAQRTAGAATAIVQHPTLLHDLMQRTIRMDECMEGNDKMATSTIATIRLCCILARQSRTAARGLDQMMLTLLPCLTRKHQSNTSSISHDEQRVLLQQWTLEFWRTRLRYGLSLAELPTLLTLATPHCALGPDYYHLQHDQQHVSLAPLFYSAFSIVLHCIRALKAASNITEKLKNEQDDDIVYSDDRALLAQAGVWLSSSRRQALQDLMDSPSSSRQPVLPRAGEEERTRSHRLRFITSILRYLDAWFLLSRTNVENDSGDFKAEEITEKDEERCLEAMVLLLRDEEIKPIMQVALQLCFQTQLSALPNKDTVHLELEASSCAFVDALVTLATSVSISCSLEQSSLVTSIRNALLESVETSTTSAEDGAELTNFTTQQSRRCWLNRTHAAVVRFLACTATGPAHPIAQSIGLTVIGRLERGEESTATLLFSCDNLFWCDDSNNDPSLNPSPISTFFVRELCLTQQARSQLDHSFKLRNALGISSDKLGPFQLQSLRSEADRTSPSAVRDDLLLPMGNLWLWKTFAGSLMDHQLGADALQVLTTTLQLVRQLETTTSEGHSRAVEYSRNLNIGGRLYYVMNLCLQPQGVIENDEVRSAIDRLIDHYTTAIVNVSIGDGFGEECESHSAVKGKEKSSTNDEKQMVDEEKLTQLLDPPVPSNDAWSKKRLRSVESFLSDMCDAFLEYGAQYPFFTKSLRLFLASSFPSQIRCALIFRLRDVLHLLTPPLGEDLNPLLRICVSGGLPTVDQSARDTPDILDAACSILAKGKSIRSDSAFAESWATALLARSLAIHVLDGSESGLSASKRRFQGLEQQFASRVLVTTEAFLTLEGTLDDLTTVSLRPYRDDDCREEFRSFGDDHGWNRALVVLKEMQQ